MIVHSAPPVIEAWVAPPDLSAASGCQILSRSEPRFVCMQESEQVHAQRAPEDLLTVASRGLCQGVNRGVEGRVLRYLLRWALAIKRYLNRPPKLNRHGAEGTAVRGAASIYAPRGRGASDSSVHGRQLLATLYPSLLLPCASPPYRPEMPQLFGYLRQLVHPARGIFPRHVVT